MIHETIFQQHGFIYSCEKMFFPFILRQHLSGVFLFDRVLVCFYLIVFCLLKAGQWTIKLDEHPQKIYLCQVLFFSLITNYE